MVPYLIPCMPNAAELLPYLEQMDHNRWYSNNGPLHRTFAGQLHQQFFNKSDISLALTCSGTSALEVALSSLTLPAKAKVLMPAFTYPATAMAVISRGHEPVYADVDDASWLLTPELAYQYCQQADIDLVMPVCAFGAPADNPGWQQFGKDSQIPVLVDAAPALFNQQVASGIHYCFSLHATKSFGIGEGGVIASQDQEFISRANRLKNFGFNNWQIVERGVNAKLSEYHCAVGLAQIPRSNMIRNRLRLLEQEYRQRLDGNVWRFQEMQSKHLPANLAIRLNTDEDVSGYLSNLQQNQIQARRAYWPILSDQPALKQFSRASNLSVCNKLRQSSIVLPYYPALDIEDLVRVCESLNWLSQNNANIYLG